MAEQKPIRCLVIQLTRLGDTLQSLMALRAAKQLYPDLEIHFVARERFAAAAKRVPWVKNVITLPTATLLGPVLTGKKTETEGLADLAQWIAPLMKDSWDFVINWSYSDSSSFLTAMVPAKVKLGFTRRLEQPGGSLLACADGWSQYIQGVVQARSGQNIHLTDVLTTQLLTALQIHIGEPVDDGNAPVTSKSFFNLELGERDLELPMHFWAVDSTRKWIAIQLGAGNYEKTWGPENWAGFANLVLKRHPEIHFVLLGGEEDQAASKKFIELVEDGKRILSLVGQTDFDLWASIVSRVHWVIAGDTAVIHLASVLGTRVLNVSVGPVVWAETGPYGNSHYVVSSANPCSGCQTKGLPHTCRTDVTSEAVYASWAYASSEWSHRRQRTIEEHFSNLGYTHALRGVRVHRSKIRASNDGGGVVYELMNKTSMDLQEWNSIVMGHVARSWYCGWVPPVGQELPRERISPALIQQLRELGESLNVLTKIWEESHATSIALAQKSSRVKSDHLMDLTQRTEITELGKKSQELEKLANRLVNTQRAGSNLRGLNQLAQVMMHNLRGTQVSEVSRESAEAFKLLVDGAKIYGDWLKFTLALAKPVVIERQPPVLTAIPGGPLN